MFYKIFSAIDSFRNYYDNLFETFSNDVFSVYIARIIPYLDIDILRNLFGTVYHPIYMLFYFFVYFFYGFLGVGTYIFIPEFNTYGETSIFLSLLFVLGFSLGIFINSFIVFLLGILIKKLFSKENKFFTFLNKLKFNYFLLFSTILGFLSVVFILIIIGKTFIYKEEMFFLYRNILFYSFYLSFFSLFLWLLFEKRKFIVNHISENLFLYGILFRFLPFVGHFSGLFVAISDIKLSVKLLYLYLGALVTLGLSYLYNMGIMIPWGDIKLNLSYYFLIFQFLCFIIFFTIYLFLKKQKRKAS
ncbi:hypothetical protein D8B46_00870 [Candidatus Gracilibacteria bacterium]|nr:MAG: hypothetical protein D8B46_00870 [Candidatus Gracilibacteria bacterium]